MITAPRLGELGQLGNQLFQLSTLIGVANKNNYEYCIPLESFDKRGKEYVHKTNSYYYFGLSVLECFEFDVKIIPLNELQIGNIYEEKQHHFDENIFNIPDNTFIMGYFETEKYFKHCSDLLRGMYKFRPKIEKITEERIKKINPDNKKLLSLHLRIGLAKPVVSDVHPYISAEYYNNCLSHFNSDEWKLIIFSDDDFEWAKENIKFGDIHYHEWCKEYHRPDFIDLCMMTHCDSHIIANSSFSWWGAWLAKNRENQKVFAPKTWFGPALSNKSTEDLVPDNWYRIY
jgi:hypothetical protein